MEPGRDEILKGIEAGHDLPLAPILAQKLRNMHPEQLATILTEQDRNE